MDDMNRMFLIEKGKFVVVRDGEKEVSFSSFSEFNKYYPGLDLTGKKYLDYEPDRGVFIDSTNKKITVKDAPILEYEAVIDAIDQLISDKADASFGKTPDQVQAEKEAAQKATLIQQEIRQIAIDSLKSKGKLDLQGKIKKV